jgi:hypothetical protein
MSLPNHPIYLDNHATTPMDPRVIQAMRPFWEAQFANPASPFKKLIPPSLDDIRMDIELLGQRLLALHSSKRHLRLEGWAMVPAWSSHHGISCSRHHAAVRREIHLYQLFRLPGPDLPSGATQGCGGSDVTSQQAGIGTS